MFANGNLEKGLQVSCFAGEFKQSWIGYACRFPGYNRSRFENTQEFQTFLSWIASLNRIDLS